MIKSKVTEGESVQLQALEETLQRILERAQLRFKNELIVLYSEPNPKSRTVEDHPYFSIAEVRKTYWLGFIPRKKYCILFSIMAGTINRSNGKQVDCELLEPLLLDIIDEELREYAASFKEITFIMAEVNFLKPQNID